LRLRRNATSGLLRSKSFATTCPFIIADVPTLTVSRNNGLSRIGRWDCGTDARRHRGQRDESEPLIYLQHLRVLVQSALQIRIRFSLRRRQSEVRQGRFRRFLRLLLECLILRQRRVRKLCAGYILTHCTGDDDFNPLPRASLCARSALAATFNCGGA
jgi:hypothetical protein